VYIETGASGRKPFRKMFSNKTDAVQDFNKYKSFTNVYHSIYWFFEREEKFDANDIMGKPNLDPNNEDDLVMYMAKGVDDFTIQYVGLDFDNLGNVVEEFEFNEWRPENKDIRDAPVEWKNKSFAPLAFKFTFTLYDSKGIIENGRRFTHIVYLGD